MKEHHGKTHYFKSRLFFEHKPRCECLRLIRRMGQLVDNPARTAYRNHAALPAPWQPEPQAPFFKHQSTTPAMTSKLPPLPADALAMGTITGKTVQLDPLTGLPALFVYQRTSSAFANHASTTHPRLQLRREVGGKKGSTPAMEAHRTTFAEGVTAYKAMTPEERASVLAEQRAANYRGNLYAYFMSRWMHLHSTP